MKTGNVLTFSVESYGKPDFFKTRTWGSIYFVLVGFSLWIFIKFEKFLQSNYCYVF